MIALKQTTRLNSRVGLAVLWLVTVLCAVLSLAPGLQGLAAAYGISGALFICTLSWRLAHLPPRPADLPSDDLLRTRRIGVTAAAGFLIAGAVVLVFVGMVIGPGAAALVLSGLASVGISWAWRRDVNSRTLRFGVLVGAIAAAGVAGLGNGDLSWAALNLICLPPTFIAGVLLARRTGLAQVRSLNGEYRLAARGFLAGCVLGIPAALFNLLGNLQTGDTWVGHVWQPLYAIVPALAEETWARLFLLTLIYAVLRRTGAGRPARTIGLAIVGSALVHGFAHTGINLIGLVIGSLLYGVPAGLLLLKKDFEHAVGYHFLIDLVRWVVALAV